MNTRHIPRNKKDLDVNLQGFSDLVLTTVNKKTKVKKTAVLFELDNSQKFKPFAL